MSCVHGNWSPCSECDVIDDAYRQGFAAGKAEAAQALQAEPEGWVLVPRVPTAEMIEAGIMFGTSPNKATIIFQSMCNAAPSPTAALQAGEV